MLFMNIIIGWLVADLITGLVHWFEDKYLDANTQIGRDNILHHNDPRAMTKISYWENVEDSVRVAIPIIIFTLFLQWPLWFYLAIAFSSIGNLVHRWAHEPRPPWIVKQIQKTGLIVSTKSHMKHHAYKGQLITKAQASDTYCAMTDWLNPVLNKIQFWAALEWVMALIGFKKISDV